MGRDIENPSPRLPAASDQLSHTNVSTEFNREQENPSSGGDYSKHIQERIASLEAELENRSPDGVHVELQAANTPDSINPDDDLASGYTSSTRTTEDLGFPANSVMSAESSLSAISGANGSARSKMNRRVSFEDDLQPVAPAASRPSELRNRKGAANETHDRIAATVVSPHRSQLAATFLENEINKGDEIMADVMSEEERQQIELNEKMTHEEHNSYIERTARTRLMENDIIPEGAHLADNLDLRRCISTRWGHGLQSIWSSLQPIQRTKSKFHKTASCLNRAAGGGWFTGQPMKEPEPEPEPESEWGSDVGCCEFPHFTMRMLYQVLTLSCVALAAHLVSDVCYCLTAEQDINRMDRCWLNYRTKLTGGVVDW